MATRFPRLRIALAWLALATINAPVALAQARLGGPLGRQVITSEMIRAAGILRLGDVLTLVDGWGATTVEGFTWQTSARGLEPFGQANWSLMLDGQVLLLNHFGVQSLNRIPITLGQIDSIEVVSEPALLNSGFARDGTIRIHTRRPPPGTSVRARIASANETGDPGPYRFTRLATPNIDRIGTGVEGSVTYSGRGAYLDVGGMWQEHFVTDPPIRVRSFDISADEYPIIKQGSLSLRGGFGAVGGRHAIYIGHSRIRDYYFFKPFGREVPVQGPYTHVGADGAFALSGRTALRYRAAFSSNVLEKHSNSLDIDFDWKLSTWTVAIEATRRHRRFATTVGAGIERSSAATGYTLSKNDFVLARAFGAIEYHLGWRSAQALTLALTAGEDDVALAAAFAHRWHPRGRQWGELVLSYSERLTEEDSRIWIWHERGYRFLPDNGVTVTATGEPRSAKMLAGDLCWRSVLGPGLRLRLGGYVRSHSRLVLEAQPYTFDIPSHSFSGPVTVMADQSGEIAGAELGVDWEAAGSLHLRGYYRYQDALGGAALFRRTWRTVPRHVLRVTALYEPWPGVSFWGQARYRGSGYWHDYSAADEQTDGLYSARVDEALALDLALQKYFWDSRLRLQLVFRNLLNDAVPHHPIGAAYGLSFAVQGEVRFDAIR